MGFIPIFLTMGSAIILFFLTVKKTLQRKLNLQKELLNRLRALDPVLSSSLEGKENLDEITQVIKEEKSKKSLILEALGLVKEMKINRHQYNQLIAKAPYNWVAKLSNFQPI